LLNFGLLTSGGGDLASRLMIWMPIFLVSITLHEFGHAYTAYRLGDQTPKLDGRLSLNPVAHLDPIGTLMILFGPIGWAKPVRIDPSALKGRYAELMVSLAGPLANLILAVLAVVILKHVPIPVAYEGLIEPLQVMMMLNLALAVFNLLPIPPLDGGHILQNLLPYRWRPAFYQIMPYGVIVLVLLILGPMVVPGMPSVLGMLMRQALEFLLWIVP
jgi:Zn-dependent protease